MANTKISWTDRVWNPVSGCTKISEGCRSCYAARMANRLRGRCGYPMENPFQVTIHKDKFNEPMKVYGEKKIFVCSMSDLFHDDVPEWEIRQMFQIMAYCKKHTFQVLTKRPERMRKIIDSFIKEEDFSDITGTPVNFPINNIWLGVSAENQEMADLRIPTLLLIPAAVRFVSVEPILGSVDLRHIHYQNTVEIDSLTGDHGVFRPLQGKSDKKIDWVIVGGESGTKARKLHEDWIRSLRDQCQETKTAFFFKQWGSAVYTGSALKESSLRQAGYDYIQKHGGNILDGKQYHEFPEVV